jgi:hypothetical protein
MIITLALSRPPESREGADFARRVLLALAGHNAAFIRAGLLPRLYESKVRYRREKGESFQDALCVLRQGWGDCSNLAAWRAAELMIVGQLAGIHVRWREYRDGLRGYHVLVRKTDGLIEDPSRLLGM